MPSIRGRVNSIFYANRRFRIIVSNILRPIKCFLFPPVLIYSIGKVGSTSVNVSLTKAHLRNPIFHIHRLSWNTIKETYEYYQKAGLNVPQHIAESKKLRSFIDKTQGKITWKIISLTRDPIALTISAFFENLKIYPELKNLAGDELVNGILTHLEKSFNEFDEENDYASNWFNWELKDVFGFDVYAESFEPAAGYKIAKAENADILIIKLEDLSRCAPEALQKFLGVHDFRLIKANVGSDKSYKEVYQQVLNTISLPQDVLDKIYRSRHARQFYTEEEINTFKRRWTSKD